MAISNQLLKVDTVPEGIFVQVESTNTAYPGEKTIIERTYPDGDTATAMRDNVVAVASLFWQLRGLL